MAFVKLENKNRHPNRMRIIFSQMGSLLIIFSFFRAKGIGPRAKLKGIRYRGYAVPHYQLSIINYQLYIIHYYASFSRMRRIRQNMA